MIVPQHLFPILDKLVKELEKQSTEIRNDVPALYHWAQVKRVQEELQIQNDQRYNSQYYYVDMMELMYDVIRAAKILSEDSAQRVFEEVTIEAELIYALNHANLVHPNMVKEINLMSDFLKTVPHISWLQVDSKVRMREFKLVRTKEQWNRHLKNGGYDIGTNFQNAYNFKYLRICYVHTDAPSYLTGVAEKAYQMLVSKVGEEVFAKYQEAFNLWFQIGAKGTYYVYVPK